MAAVQSIVVVAALLLAVPATPAGAAELPASLEVTFGEQVSPATRWHVEAAVRQGWERFAPLLDDLDADVVVVADADAAADAWAERRGVSRERAARQFTARSGHFAGLATTGLTVIINDGGHAGATIHELVHLVQHELCECGYQGPRWLSEGAAEWFTHDVEAAWGIDASARGPRVANREIADDWFATYGHCRSGALYADGETCAWATESLRNLEGAAGFDIGGGAVGAYDRAGVAFQYLIDTAGEQSYVCFLEAQAQGAGWETAFRTCTGRTAGQFYDDFDAYRARGFIRHAPPLRHQLA